MACAEGNLTNLEKLNLSGNLCNSMPSSLTCLSKLTSFLCADNMLTAAPEMVFSIKCLQEVDLSGNLLLETLTHLKAINREGVVRILDDLKNSAGAAQESDPGPAAFWKDLLLLASCANSIPCCAPLHKYHDESSPILHITCSLNLLIQV